MRDDLPAPPGSDTLRPVLETLPEATPLWRCHSPADAAGAFNPGRGQGRFHPFTDSAGQTVPTLYASLSFAGALSETLFHNVPRTGSGSAARTLRRGRLADYCRSMVRCRRALRLIALHGPALGHLPVTEAQLIHSPASSYPATAAWASALHGSAPDADGLVWRSRQDSDSLAVVLFGDRVAERELDTDLHVNGQPLALPPVEIDVYEVANAAGITITL